MMSRLYLLCPHEDDILIQEVSIIEVFENDGHSWQQLTLMKLHQTFKASQQILLRFLIVVAELQEKENLALESKALYLLSFAEPADHLNGLNFIYLSNG